jgi:predicted PurR-regulated permease PerM
MATIINTTPTTSDSNSSMGFLIGMVLLALVVVLFLFYGLPMLFSGMRSVPAEVPQAPAQQEGTNIQIPDQIDVNLNQGSQ